VEGGAWGKKRRTALWEGTESGDSQKQKKTEGKIGNLEAELPGGNHGDGWDDQGKKDHIVLKESDRKDGLKLPGPYLELKDEKKMDPTK